MKRKKRLFVALGAIIIAALAFGAIYHFMFRRTYELHLPQADDLDRISLAQGETGKVILDNKKINEILNIIGGTQRTTKEESIQDAPVNVDGEIKVDFHFAEGGASTLFIYEKNGKYFIEQPYNGIYQMDEEEYIRLLAACQMEPSGSASNPLASDDSSEPFPDSRTPEDPSEPSLDFQMPDDSSVTKILHDGIEYHPYGLPKKADMSNQIGTVNGDAKHKVYTFRDFPMEEFIIEQYESGLMDNPMLFRAADCDAEPEDMYILENEQTTGEP